MGCTCVGEAEGLRNESNDPIEHLCCVRSPPDEVNDDLATFAFSPEEQWDDGRLVLVFSRSALIDVKEDRGGRSLQPLLLEEIATLPTVMLLSVQFCLLGMLLPFSTFFPLSLLKKG